ncbi:MAG: DUF6491 family protein [Lysobacterales bacterium]
MTIRRIPVLLLGMAVFAVGAATVGAATPPPGSDAKDSDNIRIRPSDIRTWKAVDQTSLIITTRNHQRYLVELKRSCNNLRGSTPNDNALYTNERYIDRRGAIRLLPRDRLDRLFDHQSRASVDFAMDMEANSDYCPIQQITALGREEKRKT